jgi:PKD repeat protein
VTYHVPEKIQAARAITINGHAYAKDDVLTKAQVLAIPHLSSLLASGRLKAVPDPSHRKAVKGGRTPTNVPPKALAEMYADVDPGVPVTNYLVTVTRTGRIATVTIVGGQPPWTINWDDTVGPVEITTTDAPVTMHAYAAAAVDQNMSIGITGGDAQYYGAYSITVPAAPVAAFTSVATLLSVVFTNTSTGVGNTHSWDFGDGSTLVTTAAPTHVFAGAGTYHVTLTETNAQGVSSVTHDSVVVAA